MKSKHFKTPARLTALAAALLLTTAAQAAVVIVKDPTLTSNIPGLTGFATTGAMMSGMGVTATFSGGFTESVAWTTTGADSGAATGTNWSLSLAGDSFSSNWNFVFSAPPGGPGLGQLLSLELDGSTGLTVFDTTQPSFGTPGSAQGRDFAFAGGACAANACDATATYTNVVQIGAAAAVGDLYQTLAIAFAVQNAPRTNFSFVQDTDNDQRFFDVPEPGGLAVAGLALAALAASSRRRPR